MPGDRSLSCLAVIMGGLSSGETRIAGLAHGGDVAATVRAMRALGARVDPVGDEWLIRGTGNGALLAPQAPLVFEHSRAAAALLMGLVGPYDFETIIACDAECADSAVVPVSCLLAQMGVQLSECGSGGRSVVLHGPATANPVAGRAAAAEVKAALLLAGLNTPGVTTVTEEAAMPDRIEHMLRAFGVELDVKVAANGLRTICVEGRTRLSGLAIDLPGDPAVAACLIVAALIVDGADVTIENVLMDESGSALVKALVAMGGDIALLGEPIGNIAGLRVRSSRLRGMSVAVARSRPMAEIYPALAVAAAFAEGETVLMFDGASSDDDRRLGSLAKALLVNGVECKLESSRMTLRGNGHGHGYGQVGAPTAVHSDPVLAMGMLVMGLASEYPVTVDDASSIANDFPDFMDLLAVLGARIETRIESEAA